MFKTIWLIGMAITAILITIGLIIFRRKPIKEDLVVIAIWPYFLLYGITFVSVGLFAYYNQRKKVNKL